MEDIQQDDRDPTDEAEDKLIEIEEVLTLINNGTYKVYKFNGKSKAWDKFVKIRTSDGKERIPYVQCTECLGLLSFKKHSGTTHLNRHVCRINEDPIDQDSFRELTPGKIAEIQSALVKSTMKFCARDFISVDAICESPNHLDYLQEHVSFGNRHGNFNLKLSFPSSNVLCQEMSRFTEEKHQEIYLKFRESLKNNWCSASLETQMTTGAVKKHLMIMRIRFFEKDLSAMMTKIIFTISIDQLTSETFLENLIKRFNIFGGDEKDLQRLKIVIPNEEMILKAFDRSFAVNTCAASTIINILDKAFEKSLTLETDEFLTSCRSIVRYISTKDNYNLELVDDNGTWKNKLLMIRSINEKYKDVANVLNAENQVKFQFNKRKAKELISLLDPFIEALDDLLSTTHTTANKILLWWDVLNDHLQTVDDYGYESKQILINAKSWFQSTFIVSMENKVDCFLDPRYKLLPMLSECDRSETITEVEDLLRGITIDVDASKPSTSKQPNFGPQPKKSRLDIFESDKVKTQRAKQSSAAKKDPETDENDEIKKYMKLPKVISDDLESELDIITKFWKSKQKMLPRLFKLATTRLHIPASCGNVGQNGLNLKQDLKDKHIDDFFFIGDNL